MPWPAIAVKGFVTGMPDSTIMRPEARRNHPSVSSVPADLMAGIKAMMAIDSRTASAVEAQCTVFATLV